MYVLSMKDPYGPGHLVYYYNGSDVYMHIIYAFDLTEDINGKCSWITLEDIEKEFTWRAFSRHSLKWARLRGVPI